LIVIGNKFESNKKME